MLLYTVIGFFIAPYIIRQQMASMLSETLDRPVVIDKFHLNPYVLSAAVEGFGLTEKDGVAIASFDRLYINFQLSSLFNRAWTFKEITLENPDISAVRHKSGSFNLLELMPESEPKPDDEASSGIPPLLLESLNLTAGKLHFTDHTKPSTYTTTLTPINLHLYDLGTRQGDDGHHLINLSGESGTSLSVEGDLSVTPLKIDGTLQATGPYFPVAYGYLKDLLNIEIASGDLDLKIQFSVSENPDQYRVKLDGNTVSINNLSVLNKADDAEMLSLAHISLTGLTFAWPEKSLNAQGIALGQGALSVIREQDGTLNWQHIMASQGAVNVIPDQQLTLTTAIGTDVTNSTTTGIATGTATGLVTGTATDVAAGIDNALNSTGDNQAVEFTELANESTASDIENTTTDTNVTVTEPLDTSVGGADDNRSVANTTEAESANGPKANVNTPGSSPGSLQPQASGLSLLPDWSIKLSRASIADVNVTVVDRSLKYPANINIRNIDINVADISNQPEAVFPTSVSATVAETGQVGYQGEVVLQPDWNVKGKITVDTLPLTLLDPYIGNYLKASLTSGTLSLASNIESNAVSPLKLSADLNVDNLDIQTAEKNQPLLKWQRLNIKNIVVATNPLVVSTNNITLDQPYFRFNINEDQTTNIQALMIAEPQSPLADTTSVDSKKTTTDAEASVDEAEDSAPTDPLNVSVNEVIINDATVDFSDYALPIPFDDQLSKLNGEFNGFSTAEKIPGTIKLKGQVGKYGSVDVSGEVSPWDFMADTQIILKMKNVEMPDLAPYTIKFVGREIADGKLNLDLDYRFDSGQLQGKNKVVLTSFELGKKVPQEGALDLPLGLAVALLKGPDGTIDIDLPISGDTNNPQFSIGSIVLKVFGNLITKAVTAPFKLLGALVGSSDENFDKVYFEPGSADITPPEQEKLDKLIDALKQRPQLGIEVKGVYASAEDTLAIQRQKLDQLIDTARLEEFGEDSKTPRSAQRIEIMVGMFEEAFGDASHDALQEKHPPFEEGVLPKAYRTELRTQLLTTLDVSPAELEQLATNRASNIVSKLTADTEIKPKRLTIKDSAAVKKAGKEGVPLKMEVSNIN